MATTFRYKYVKNSTNNPLTVSNFPVTNDGDDVQIKFIKHPLVADDFGGTPGQIDYATGLIVDVIPSNFNVLWFELKVFRPTLAGGVNKYNELTNQLEEVAVDFSFQMFDLDFWLETDNTLRAYDKGNAQAAAHLVAGDVITGFIIIGQNQDSRDKMN